MRPVRHRSSWSRSAGLALLVLACATPLASQTDDLSAPVTLAVVRADGLLIPFATWDSKRWVNEWPVPEKSADTPITTADIPRGWWAGKNATEEWHVWRVDGSRTQALVKRPSWYLAHCQQGVGLVTNLEVRQQPPPVVQPYPKVGLASSVPVKFAPIAVLGQNSPAWKAIPAAITAHVDVEETLQANHLLQRAGWQHPRDPAERREVPVEVQALYRSPVGDGRFLYYFEAIKRYTLRNPPLPDPARPRRPGDDCAAITFVSGWLVAGNSDAKVVVTAPLVRISSCDFGEADVMLPLAYVSGPQGPSWIVQMSGWGRERFVIAQWDPATAKATPLFETRGGECPLVR